MLLPPLTGAGASSGGSGGGSPTVATGAEITTGTNNTKFASPQALADAGLFSTATRKLSYVEFTSPKTITSTSSGSPDNIVSSAAVTVDGSTEILVEFWCPGVFLRTGGSNPIMSLWDGSTELGTAELYIAGATGTEYPCSFKRYLTPSSGSHTYHIKAWDSVGSPGPIFQVGVGGAGVYMPGFIRVTK